MSGNCRSPSTNCSPLTALTSVAVVVAVVADVAVVAVADVAVVFANVAVVASVVCFWSFLPFFSFYFFPIINHTIYPSPLHSFPYFLPMSSLYSLPMSSPYFLPMSFPLYLLLHSFFHPSPHPPRPLQTHHKKCLEEFFRAQRNYHELCAQETSKLAEELQKM